MAKQPVVADISGEIPLADISAERTPERAKRKRFKQLYCKNLVKESLTSGPL